MTLIAIQLISGQYAFQKSFKIIGQLSRMELRFETFRHRYYYYQERNYTQNCHVILKLLQFLITENHAKLLEWAIALILSSVEMS